MKKFMNKKLLATLAALNLFSAQANTAEVSNFSSGMAFSFALSVGLFICGGELVRRGNMSETVDVSTKPGWAMMAVGALIFVVTAGFYLSEEYGFL